MPPSSLHTDFSRSFSLRPLLSLHSGKNKLHLQHVNYSDRRSELCVTVTQVFDFTASLRWDGHSVTQLPWVEWGRGGVGGKLNLLLHRDILHHSFCIIWHVAPPVHAAAAGGSTQILYLMLRWGTSVSPLRQVEELHKHCPHRLHQISTSCSL